MVFIVEKKSGYTTKDTVIISTTVRKSTTKKDEKFVMPGIQSYSV